MKNKEMDSMLLKNIFQQVLVEVNEIKSLTEVYSSLIEKEYKKCDLFFLKNYLEMFKSDDNGESINTQLEKLKLLCIQTQTVFENYITNEIKWGKKGISLGGKNQIINLDSMNDLFIEGCNSIDSLKKSMNNIERIVSDLREVTLVGEKGLICRKTLNSIFVVTNDLSRTAEKVAVYMEAKINRKGTNTQSQQSTLKQRDSNLFIKR